MPHSPDTQANFVPTHIHKKGGRYRFIARATATDDIKAGEEVVHYQHESGSYYSRPARLFDEPDRFAPLPSVISEKTCGLCGKERSLCQHL